MIDDIILDKKESIERCISQIEDYYNLDREIPFDEDYLVQDAISANVQRACDLAIDIANRTIKLRKLGLPRDSRDSFMILARAKIIPSTLADSLAKMVGFRNILVHQYKELDTDLMKSAIEHDLADLVEFTTLIVREFESDTRE